MGHGKETPRQKMIGMMYLVLTALLALNVSKDILNAFVLVDQSLNKTVDNFSSKSAILYTALDKAAATNPMKAGELSKKAKEVKERSDELSKYIDELKSRLYLIADKVEVGLDTVRNYSINAKDNQDVGGQVMIVEKKGAELKEKLNEYREALIAITGNTEQAQSLVESLKKSLDTTDPTKPNAGGAMEKWEQMYFEHLPLVAVTTNLTKIQTDIRNSESDVVSYLVGQIGADDFRFNKIEAIVLPKSNYVMLGGKYEADVFIAASDSTVTPEITLDGGTKLSVVDGKGKYTAAASGVGDKTWGGVIKLITPTKQEKIYKFKSTYMVGEPSATVSPSKMNVFYVGVDNPVEILASGVAAEKLRPSISSGSITAAGGGGKYVVRVKKPGEKVTINVNAEIDGQSRSMGAKEFRVKTVPDPIGKVGGITGGVIAKNILQAQAGVAAELQNFDFDLKFVVQSFTVSATVRGYEEEARSNNYQFTAKQKELIGKLQSQAKLYISDIKASGPDGTVRDLPSISLRLK